MPATRSGTRRRSRRSSRSRTSPASKLFPFFFVGCWNKGSASQGAVINAMKELSVKINPKYIILGGDNIYPEKDATGRKIYSSERLQSGYEAMASLNVPIIASLGNHNIVDPTIYNTEMHKLGWTIPNNYYYIRFPSDNIQLVVLDTNLYQDNDEATLIKRKDQEEWLEALLQAAKPRYETIIVQHQPLMGYKKKKQATILALPNAERLHEILSVHRPVAVLSADIHNYQDLELESPRVHQLIVGTGGADLDELPMFSGSKPPNIRDAYYGNGFLVVNGIRPRTRGSPPKLDYTFIAV